MQLSVVDRQMWKTLRGNHIEPGTAVYEGIKRALGLPASYDEQQSPGEAGVYAFHIADLVFDPENPTIVVFFATGGRLVRYEWTKHAAMSTTLPLDRISQIDELEHTRPSAPEDSASAEGGAPEGGVQLIEELVVTIRVDSHNQVVTTQTEGRTQLVELPGANGEVEESSMTVTVGQGRSEGLVWRLTERGEKRAGLAEFSRQLRVLLGS